MFTGLIEEIGEIISKSQKGLGITFGVKANAIFDDLKIDDSVAINGACQTVTKIENGVFFFDSIETTIEKTNFSALGIGSKVNLERAMKLNSRFGGHFVQGHIDCVGIITSIKPDTLSTNFYISYPIEFSKYLIKTGSITINGISLTISDLYENYFIVSIIPHTIDNTTLKYSKLSDKVNLEFDLLGKYIEKLLISGVNYRSNQESSLEKYITQPY